MDGTQFGWKALDWARYKLNFATEQEAKKRDPKTAGQPPEPLDYFIRNVKELGQVVELL